MKEVEKRGYTSITHFASGGEGNIYTCQKQGVKYIVKVVDALESDQIEMLKRVNALRNEHFSHIVDIINEGDKTLIVREYIEGTTLTDEIKKNGSFSYNRAKEVLFDICSALRVLHSMRPHPIIYRDLKPDNVIITSDGKVKLIDFGIARYHKQESTRDTLLAGTKGYTAPEVMAGMQSDVRSDVYSIGLVFYELLSGKSLQDPPYQIRPVAENNEFIPDYIDEIISKATDINQTHRHESIDEFVHELENIKEVKEKKKKRKRRVMLFIALGIVALLVVIGLIIVPMLDAEKFEMLLELDFEDEADLHFIGGYQDPEGRFEIGDGVLHVLQHGCNLDYMPSNNMVLHFRMKTTNPGGAIGLSQYRINPSLEFECIYYDQEKKTDMTTWNIKLDGLVVANSEQWLDLMLYTNEENSAMYAIICDNENGSIAYTAYQIPEFFNEENFYVEMVAFFDGEDEYMMIDQINIAEGSLRQYLLENMPAYAQHKKRIDEFLNQDVSVLPEMDFKPASEWLQ